MREPAGLAIFSFNVDELGNVTDLLLNDEPLSRYVPRRSEVSQLNPGAEAGPSKKARG